MGGTSSRSSRKESNIIKNPTKDDIIGLINKDGDEFDDYIGVLFNYLLVLDNIRQIALIHFPEVDKDNVKDIIKLNLLATNLGIKGYEILPLQLNKPYSFYVFNDNYTLKDPEEQEIKYPKTTENFEVYYDDNNDINNTGLTRIARNLHFPCDCDEQDKKHQITISIKKGENYYPFYKIFCDDLNKSINNQSVLSILKSEKNNFDTYKNDNNLSNFEIVGCIVTTGGEQTFENYKPPRPANPPPKRSDNPLIPSNPNEDLSSQDLSPQPDNTPSQQEPSSQSDSGSDLFPQSDNTPSQQEHSSQSEITATPVGTQNRRMYQPNQGTYYQQQIDINMLPHYNPNFYYQQKKQIRTPNYNHKTVLKKQISHNEDIRLYKDIIIGYTSKGTPLYYCEYHIC